MVTFLLFVILVVLLYATGLLPGIFRFFALLLSVMLVAYMGEKYGWGVVMGGSAAAAAAAFFAVVATLQINPRAAHMKRSRDTANEQLDRINKKQQRGSQQ